MKKISLLIAFVALFATASFASPTTVREEKITEKAAINVVDFPVTFVTSCGTWTGTANCGSLTMLECGNFLNDVGNFLESLCED